MNDDSLLPPDIKITSGTALDGSPAVDIDLGKLLQLGDVSAHIVLPLLQAKILGSRIIEKAYEIERHGLRLVNDEDGA